MGFAPGRRGFRLRLYPNIKFHNGTPLDAALARDILLDRLAKPSPMTVGLGSVAGIDVEDNRTFVLKLSRPKPFFPQTSRT